MCSCSFHSQLSACSCYAAACPGAHEPAHETSAEVQQQATNMHSQKQCQVHKVTELALFVPRLLLLQADLDLGNYERFLDVTLTRDNNLTTGKVYQVRSSSWHDPILQRQLQYQQQGGSCSHSSRWMSGIYSVCQALTGASQQRQFSNTEVLASAAVWWLPCHVCPVCCNHHQALEAGVAPAQHHVCVWRPVQCAPAVLPACTCLQSVLDRERRGDYLGKTVQVRAGLAPVAHAVAEPCSNVNAAVAD